MSVINNLTGRRQHLDDKRNLKENKTMTSIRICVVSLASVFNVHNFYLFIFLLQM